MHHFEILGLLLLLIAQGGLAAGREQISLNKGWRFSRSTSNPDGLSYSRLKQWIMPAANGFIQDSSRRYQVPRGSPPTVQFAESVFDDSSWEAVDLPHDWAIKLPFEPRTVTTSMGSLPSYGVGWYRRTLDIEKDDLANSIFYLDVDGAMSYATVWLNGELVGGWPYGYNSFRLDLTEHMSVGENQLAIRVDNAKDNSRWYPGAGIYRNVWLTKVHSGAHVDQWGTSITSKDISESSATLDLVVRIKGNTAASGEDGELQIATDVHIQANGQPGQKVAEFPSRNVSLSGATSVNSSVTIKSPRLWGPLPDQTPNLYVAVTRLYSADSLIDTYETRFGIRSMTYSGDGLKVNGRAVKLNGVNQHHDLGAIGSAWNWRAAQRQLEKLQEMGCNAIRTSHNPPAPELLDLADEMGFLVLDEIFDTWQSAKVTNDFHLIFSDWYEPDLRAFMRRDRNHPSIFGWSFGNEVAEQASSNGATMAQRLHDIMRQEDPTRPGTSGMDRAAANSAFIRVMDMIGLNYQGEGRGAGSAQFPAFHAQNPSRMLFSTESSSALSSRGTYLFPVTSANSQDIGNGSGGNSTSMQASDYGLSAASWGCSPDKAFVAQDQLPYLAGQFVWTGWDYIGEPTPYAGARSSYFGIIDLAGFPKDRFYQYQQQWRKDHPMAHILPHWNWPERVGKVTPVHVFSSGDEAELFLDGKSLGRKTKEPLTYRFRWDDVAYKPGQLTVVTFKKGSDDVWANSTVRTTGEATKLRLKADRDSISSGGINRDLSFVTAEVVDKNGDVVPTADNLIRFSISGAGEIVATDNGDPTDYVAFPSTERHAFRGLALAIVRGKGEGSGTITISATGNGLEGAQVTVKVV